MYTSVWVPGSDSMPVPAWFAEVLQRELGPWLTLSDKQITQLHEHYQLLEHWNERVNLTSVKPGVDLVVRHYCESLFFGAHFPDPHDGTTIVDIGTGAGFPGVPLAILRPEWQVTLAESVQRKSVFLREATRELKNVSVLAQRAEAVQGRFDWLVSRAVHPREVLPNIPRLAPKVGLLLGEANLRLLKGFSAIAWCEPIRLPWGDRRFCIFGQCHP
jgi:16S rRNA (guanine527-N7)-methyltransferase